MADKSAFEKIHVDEREKADLGGVLEQLNLPPGVVEFVRTHQRSIYVILSIIAVVVVVWSLYGSYAEKKLTAASSALATAQDLQGEEKITALAQVAEEYAGTDPARWARIELARQAQKDGDSEEALRLYETVRRSLDQENSLYPLVIFGIAQAEEAAQKYEKALDEYQALKNIAGYESIGYNGAARIYEIQGKTEQAINQYEQYLGALDGDAAGSGERAYILEKLNRLKASL